MKIDIVRRHALSLPATTEEPHFQYSSFRVAGKIFVTVPPGEQFIHVFVPEQQRELALNLDPEFLEKLAWGTKVVGLKVALAKANPRAVLRLISEAWESKAPRKVLASRSVGSAP